MPLAEAPITDRTPFQRTPKTPRSALRSERIRVVFVTDNMRLGGTELNAVRTAERLDRERFDLRVVCLGADGPLTERYGAIHIPVENMSIRNFYGPSMLRSGWRFVRMLRRERIDIVHAHDIYSNIFSAIWAKLGGASGLITSRRWGTALPNAKLKLGNQLAVRRSSLVLANSNAVADLVVSEVPRAKSKVRTITNFVDDHAFGAPTPPEREQARRCWGAPSDAIVIGCVARFDPVKDHVGLLRAFASLRARCPNVYLVLVGDGEMRPTLERLVQELGLDSAVHFAGEQRMRTNLHRGFDISVLASISEGFPNTLVEAMAAGNPVVATAVGGSVDAVHDGETGLLVPPGRPEDLGCALSTLARSATLRERFGREGERRARRDFRASCVVPKIEQMYCALAGTPSR